jgi:hypothetical protein
VCGCDNDVVREREDAVLQRVVECFRGLWRTVVALFEVRTGDALGEQSVSREQDAADAVRGHPGRVDDLDFRLAEFEGFAVLDRSVGIVVLDASRFGGRGDDGFDVAHVCDGSNAAHVVRVDVRVNGVPKVGVPLRRVRGVLVGESAKRVDDRRFVARDDEVGETPAGGALVL